jgi:hypothetical protein
MDIWDWLDPWWAWGAAFTDLFDWEAVGALGTVGALVGALYLADSANRDRRRRDAAIILAASHPLKTAANVIAHCLTRMDEQTPREVLFQTLLEARGLHAQAENLGAFSILDLPSTKAVDPVVAGRACIDGVMRDVETALEQKGWALATLPEALAGARNRLLEYAAALQDEALRIERRGGPF